MASLRSVVSGRLSRDIWGVISLLLALALAGSVVVARLALEREEREALDRAEALVEATLRPSLPDDLMKQPLREAEEAEILDTVRVGILSDTRVLRVRIWRPDGMLMFSTDPGDEIGSLVAPIDLRIGEAVEGNTRSTVTGGAVPPGEGLAGSSERLLETFSPLRVGDEPAPVGAAEIDFRHAQLADAANAPWRPVQAVLGAALALALALLVWSLRAPARAGAPGPTPQAAGAAPEAARAGGGARAAPPGGREAAAPQPSPVGVAGEAEALARKLQRADARIGALEDELAVVTQHLRRAEDERVAALKEVEGARRTARTGLQVEELTEAVRDAEARAESAEARARRAEARAEAAETQSRELAARPAAEAASETAAALALEQRAREAEERAQQAEARMEEAAERVRQAEAGAQQAHERAQQAEGRVAGLEGGVGDLQRRVEEAEERAREMEGHLREAENRARAAEVGLEEARAAATTEGASPEALAALESIEQRVRAAEERARQAERELVNLRQAVREAPTPGVEATGLRGRLADTAARKRRAEREPRPRAGDLEEAIREAVTRELRGPVGAILGLSLSLRHAVPAGEGQELIRQLAASARRLDRLIGDLQEVGRLADGTLPLQRRRTDLEALVRRVVGEADGLGDRVVHVRTEPALASVDAARVEQIVDGLLVVARERSGRGAPIWVSVGREGDGIQLAVDDAAPLPSAAVIEVILAARLAELHGGRLRVAEREGGGTSFRVFLPGEAGGASPAAAGPEQTGSPEERG